MAYPRPPCNPSVLEGLGGPLVVHHWDADGIASAALLERLHGWSWRLVPPIGSYRVEGIAGLLASVSPGSLVVVDYGVAEQLPLLAGLVPLVAYVDHHRARLPRNTPVWACNPVAEGLGGEEDYPSTSLLLALLHRALPAHADLAAVGLVGDVPGYRGSMWWHRLAPVLGELGVGEEVLVEAVEAVDSCYPLLDTWCIERAVETLAGEGPLGVVGDPVLLAARERLRGLVERAVEEARRTMEEHGIALVARVSVDALVTSKTGRRLAKENPSKVVVVDHWIPSLAKGMVYVRSTTHSIGWLVGRGRAWGLEAGGKDMVAVIHYYQRSQGERIVERILEELGKQVKPSRGA